MVNKVIYIMLNNYERLSSLSVSIPEMDVYSTLRVEVVSIVQFKDGSFVMTRKNFRFIGYH